MSNINLFCRNDVVVPAEMPTSWAANAVRAQAVAARSYAVRLWKFADIAGSNTPVP
jgi:SpoIID/LytB domain protein